MKPQVMSTTKGLVIRIRNFEMADIRRVMEIEEEAFLEGDADLYLELYREWPEGFIVAERNDRVIGFEVLILTPEEEGRVFAIAVDSRFRGKGVGRALLKTAFNLLRKYKIGFVRLEVRVSNWIAQRLYKSMGFTEIGFVPFYYKDGEAAILMRKVL
ncbi:MAG: ribosomal protein S18-alanine N-acetyltransferase [Methanophagales archaeon]|nr:ribosomal protein S18-alanine N-acetyltransferase [Methanophagales archaeon]MCW3137197.1 ribosomal protein S18-alanine N-acetyltransferase [Methanophagales archaeon]MCW7070145.1 ribosomal protein S18-alanine N-acetyltransferase [Methanophagales archaeon]MCW7073806.1 ribosomal protein S18-alanine N-acetyltransferase [Methanophagales archaeon]